MSVIKQVLARGDAYIPLRDSGGTLLGFVEMTITDGMTHISHGGMNFPIGIAGVPTILVQHGQDPHMIPGFMPMGSDPAVVKKPADAPATTKPPAPRKRSKPKMTKEMKDFLSTPVEE